MASEGRARLLAVLALVCAAIVSVMLLSREDPYALKLEFADASQLVKGSPVQVSGESIGTVTALDLTDDGEAEIAIEITDPEYAPLHTGTLARIRTVGLSGVANRFIDLSPGSVEAAVIPDGGVIHQGQTVPQVEVDELLSTLDPEARVDIQAVLQSGSEVNRGSAADLNSALAYLNPALSQVNALSSQILRDRVAVEELIGSSRQVVGALADRRGDLEGAISGTATTLAAIAAERGSLEQLLSRSPETIVRATGTLGRLRGALAELRPLLIEGTPAAEPLARVLSQLPGFTERAAPVVESVTQLLPVTTEGLQAIPGLARAGVPAFELTARAIHKGAPVFEGLRPYAPDITVGLFNSLGAATAGYYDANGHFLRPALTQPNLAGATSELLGGLLSAAGGYRTGLIARCPGGAAEPAADGSNPWLTDATQSCDHEDDH